MDYRSHDLTHSHSLLHLPAVGVCVPGTVCLHVCAEPTDDLSTQTVSAVKGPDNERIVMVMPMDIK